MMDKISPITTARTEIYKWTKKGNKMVVFVGCAKGTGIIQSTTLFMCTM